MNTSRVVRSCSLYVCISLIQSQFTVNATHEVRLSLRSGGGPIITIRPEYAFGTGIDGHERGGIQKRFTAANVRAMKQSGFTSITYRLRSELAVASWHWNSAGTWSDPVHKQGYWVSEPYPANPVSVSRGYHLPRRGNTFDMDYNEGYSRLDDGDPNSFWKSNPYLSRPFTERPDTDHPQWIIIDPGHLVHVSAVHILWADPYATRFEVQYIQEEQPILNTLTRPGWRTFPRGVIANARGGIMRIRLTDEAINIRMLRIVLYESSGTSIPSNQDVRDKCGFAIREIYMGEETRGALRDVIHHAPSAARQTTIYASSTDPWHGERDVDPNLEHLGFDAILDTNLHNGAPALMSVPLLYSVPEDAVAQLEFLIRRGIPVTEIELGEEPDGQYCSSSDYAALWIQWVRAIRTRHPQISIGGPSLSIWDDSTKQWTEAFFKHLSPLSRSQIAFFSFEFYPYPGDCSNINNPNCGAQVMRRQIKDLRSISPLATVPIYLTEYGYPTSWSDVTQNMNAGLAAVQVGLEFLMNGGRRAFIYGYEPDYVSDVLTDNYTLLEMDAAGRIIRKTAAYDAMRMLLRNWLVSPGEHRITRLQLEGSDFVKAYLATRPDSGRAVAVFNNDQSNGHRLRIESPEKQVSVASITLLRNAQTITAMPGDVKRYGIWLPPRSIVIIQLLSTAHL
jgi:hypothetical protein